MNWFLDLIQEISKENKQDQKKKKKRKTTKDKKTENKKKIKQIQNKIQQVSKHSQIKEESQTFTNKELQILWNKKNNPNDKNEDWFFEFSLSFIKNFTFANNPNVEKLNINSLTNSFINKFVKEEKMNPPSLLYETLKFSMNILKMFYEDSFGKIEFADYRILLPLDMIYFLSNSIYNQNMFLKFEIFQILCPLARSNIHRILLALEKDIDPKLSENCLFYFFQYIFEKIIEIFWIFLKNSLLPSTQEVINTIIESFFVLVKANQKFILGQNLFNIKSHLFQIIEYFFQENTLSKIQQLSISNILMQLLTSIEIPILQEKEFFENPFQNLDPNSILYFLINYYNESVSNLSNEQIQYFEFHFKISYLNLVQKMLKYHKEVEIIFIKHQNFEKIPNLLTWVIQFSKSMKKENNGIKDEQNNMPKNKNKSDSDSTFSEKVVEIVPLPVIYIQNKLSVIQQLLQNWKNICSQSLENNLFQDGNNKNKYDIDPDIYHFFPERTSQKILKNSIRNLKNEIEIENIATKLIRIFVQLICSFTIEKNEEFLPEYFLEFILSFWKNEYHQILIGANFWSVIIGQIYANNPEKNGMIWMKKTKKVIFSFLAHCATSHLENNEVEIQILLSLLKKNPSKFDIINNVSKTLLQILKANFNVFSLVLQKNQVDQVILECLKLIDYDKRLEEKELKSVMNMFKFLRLFFSNRESRIIAISYLGFRKTLLQLAFHPQVSELSLNIILMVASLIDDSNITYIHFLNDIFGIFWILSVLHKKLNQKSNQTSNDETSNDERINNENSNNENENGNANANEKINDENSNEYQIEDINQYLTNYQDLYQLLKSKIEDDEEIIYNMSKLLKCIIKAISQNKILLQSLLMKINSLKKIQESLAIIENKTLIIEEVNLLHQLLNSNEENTQKFEKEIGFHNLSQTLSKKFQNRNTKSIEQKLFWALFMFFIDEANYIIQNVYGIIPIFEFYLKCGNEAEILYLIRAFKHLCLASIRNCECFSNEGFVFFLANRIIAFSNQEFIKESQNLLGIISSNSLSITEIKKVFSLLKGGKSPEKALNLIVDVFEQVVDSLEHKKSHLFSKSFFDFSSGYFSLPKIQKWPTKGWSFCSWIRFEEIPEEKYVLFEFRTGDGDGISLSFLADPNQSTEKTGKTETELFSHVLFILSFYRQSEETKLEFPYKIELKNWNLIGISHKMLWSKSKIKFFLNKSSQEKVSQNYPSFNDSLISNFIGTKINKLRSGSLKYNHPEIFLNKNNENNLYHENIRNDENNLYNENIRNDKNNLYNENIRNNEKKSFRGQIVMSYFFEEDLKHNFFSSFYDHSPDYFTLIDSADKSILTSISTTSTTPPTTPTTTAPPLSTTPTTTSVPTAKSLPKLSSDFLKLIYQKSFLLYHNRCIQENTCLDVSKFSSEKRKALMIGIRKCVVSSFEDILICLGGVEVFLPLLFSEKRIDNIEDEQRLNGKTFRLILKICVKFPHLVPGNFFKVLGFLMKQTDPRKFSPEIIAYIWNLLEKSKANSFFPDIIHKLLLDFDIWIRYSNEFQITFISYINMLLDDSLFQLDSNSEVGFDELFFLLSEYYENEVEEVEENQVLQAKPRNQSVIKLRQELISVIKTKLLKKFDAIPENYYQKFFSAIFQYFLKIQNPNSCIDVFRFFSEILHLKNIKEMLDYVNPNQKAFLDPFIYLLNKSNQTLRDLVIKIIFRMDYLLSFYGFESRLKIENGYLTISELMIKYPLTNVLSEQLSNLLIGSNFTDEKKSFVFKNIWIIFTITEFIQKFHGTHSIAFLKSILTFMDYHEENQVVISSHLLWQIKLFHLIRIDDLREEEEKRILSLPFVRQSAHGIEEEKQKDVVVCEEDPHNKQINTIIFRIFKTIHFRKMQEKDGWKSIQKTVSLLKRRSLGLSGKNDSLIVRKFIGDVVRSIIKNISTERTVCTQNQFQIFSANILKLIGMSLLYFFTSMEPKSPTEFHFPFKTDHINDVFVVELFYELAQKHIFLSKQKIFEEKTDKIYEIIEIIIVFHLHLVPKPRFACNKDLS
ncbi:hypothetical protein M0811_06822 [Anaeramoeba ignava]|uniref:DUF4704 domain-containing protein n=1 Tax=Anaeramoeba ignava TaxID=1746090 RepID=A0A9Q0LQB1_ANAIG|nr:hypothetical protein M0811_06822 [Anaeramoeba ignava]